MDKLAEGKRVFNIEMEALIKTRDALDETFVHILELIVNCKGKVIITGMGKPGHIATKIAATFASLGTPSCYLHPAEAQHGDLGMISGTDIVIAISNSGESDEIIKMLPNIKLIGATIVAITGNANSTLAQASDICQVIPCFKEACYLGLAPTSTTTAVLCYGDALAVVASGIYGFNNADFGKYHPAGSLGKKLVLKIDDIMAKGDNNAVVPESATLMETIVELSKKGLGIVTVIDEKMEIQGIITDGDLRRQLEKGVDIYSLLVQDITNKNPFTIRSDRLAVEALNMMAEKNVSAMPVVNGNKVTGTIRLQAIVSAGIVV